MAHGARTVAEAILVFAEDHADMDSACNDLKDTPMGAPTEGDDYLLQDWTESWKCSHP